MSIEHPMEVACPTCNHQQTVTVWESVNADVSPEAREALLRGEINRLSCEACGDEAVISVPLLYHDMRRRYVAQYLPFGMIEDDEFFDRFDDRGRDTSFARAVEASGPGIPRDQLSYMFEPHIVFQMSELVLYIRFRERLHEVRRPETEGA